MKKLFLILSIFINAYAFENGNGNGNGGPITDESVDEINRFDLFNTKSECQEVCKHKHKRCHKVKGKPPHFHQFACMTEDEKHTWDLHNPELRL